MQEPSEGQTPDSLITQPGTGNHQGDSLLTGDSKVTPDTPATDPVAVEGRLARNLPLVSLILIALSWAKVDWKFAVSVALGCGLAYLNYRWLHSSLKAILAAAAGGDTSSRRMSKFLARWLVIFAVLFVVPQVTTLSTLGILLGLFALPTAVMVEAGFQLYWVLRHGLN